MTYPKHVAIIPDGNRTRAREHDTPVTEAYMLSYEKALDLIRYTFTETDTQVFTLWGLSTENAQERPKEEFDFLMNMHKLVEEDLDDFMMEHKINFKAIGDFNGITTEFKEYLLAKEARTKCDSNKYFVFAINYGGRDEIIRGIKALAEKDTDFTHITQDQLSGALDLGGLPPIELVIRTKGDQAQRTSGFMSRRIGYAELYFTPKKCPEFEVSDYQETLKRFDTMAQLRNYGK